jgi:hypothetical protein
MTTLATFIPPFRDRTLAWLSVLQVAHIWNRSPRMIRNWIYDGTLLQIGARLYRDPHQRWWIGVARSEVPPEIAASAVPPL